MSSTHLPKKITFKSLGKVAVFAISCLIIAIYLVQIRKTPFFVDEYHFIKKSIYLEYPLPPKNVGYPLPRLEDELAQPKVGPYIYGIAFHLAGKTNIYEHLESAEFVSQSEWLKEGWWVHYWDVPLNTFPKSMEAISNIILFQRYVSLLFTFTSLFIVFVITKKIGGLMFATLSLFTVANNTLMLYNGTLATTDSMLLFFSLLALLIILKINEIIFYKITRAIVVLQILLGLILALAIGVKISGILIVIFVSIYYFYKVIISYLNKVNLRPLMMGFGITLATFILIFVAIHPYLYSNTLFKLPRMFIDRYAGTELSQRQYPKLAVRSRVESFKLVFSDTLSPNGRFVNFKSSIVPIDAILFILGILLIIKKILNKRLLKGPIATETLLVLWFLVTVFGLILYLKNNWARYFLQSEVVITIIEMYSLSFLIKLYLKFTKKLLVYGIHG